MRRRIAVQIVLLTGLLIIFLALAFALMPH